MHFQCLHCWTTAKWNMQWQDTLTHTSVIKLHSTSLIVWIQFFKLHSIFFALDCFYCAMIDFVRVNQKSIENMMEQYLQRFHCSNDLWMAHKAVATLFGMRGMQRFSSMQICCRCSAFKLTCNTFWINTFAFRLELLSHQCDVSFSCAQLDSTLSICQLYLDFILSNTFRYIYTQTQAHTHVWILRLTNKPVYSVQLMCTHTVYKRSAGFFYSLLHFFVCVCIVWKLLFYFWMMLCFGARFLFLPHTYTYTNTYNFARFYL